MRHPSRRTVAAATVVLLALLAGVAAAQSPIAPAVPRRVHISPVDGISSVRETERAAFIARLDEYLYTSISALQPIVRVHDAAEAFSTITLLVSGGTITATLRTGGMEPVPESVSAESTPARLAEWVHETAAVFAPALGFVEPAVIRSEAAVPSVRQQAIDSVDLADRLATPWELTLWALGLMRSDIGSAHGRLVPVILPVMVDAAWFPRRYLGLSASLWIQRTNALTFGRREGSDAEPGSATTVLALVGAGVEYRTLGRVGASVGISLYGGPAFVRNTSGVAIGRSISDEFGEPLFRVFLSPDEAKMVFYTSTLFEGGLTWNPTDRLSARVRFCMAINPLMLVGLSETVQRAESPGWYPLDGNSAIIFYLPIGFTYRF